MTITCQKCGTTTFVPSPSRDFVTPLFFAITLIGIFGTTTPLVQSRYPHSMIGAIFPVLGIVMVVLLFFAFVEGPRWRLIF